MAVITPELFAEQAMALRPALITFACRTCPCGEDDAEDLVSDTIVRALSMLGDWWSNRVSLRRWLTGILKCIILEDRKRTRKEPLTVPLIQALEIPATPAPALRTAFLPHLSTLPEKLRMVVQNHINGYTQEEIAFRCRIHRNTVANRMELAGQQLRCQFPDFEGEWEHSFFDWCCQHTVYHSPSGMATRWRNQTLASRKRMAGTRDPLLTGAIDRDPHLINVKRRTDTELRRRQFEEKRRAEA